MPQRQEKLRRKIDEHLTQVIETYHPACDVCGEAFMYEEGMFSMIGTDPRGPRSMSSLKCGTCGRVMFFEQPEDPSA